MVGRGELTEAAWEWMEPLLSQVDGRGRPWRDHRQVVNGVLSRLRTGAPWRDLPERYGPWQTVCERFARWEADGTWARLLEHVQVRDDTEGRVEWTVAVGSTINRAHQHAAGARRRGLRTGTNRRIRSARRRRRVRGGRGRRRTALRRRGAGPWTPPACGPWQPVRTGWATPPGGSAWRACARRHPSSPPADGSTGPSPRTDPASSGPEASPASRTSVC
ncbi:IS5 family transposase [Streptomyces sp. NPDC056257]|uniref:IS5 family transposase n=1 Tax=Streptomyces sp. NPDC056257 TaxID=3345765 RepID=UPI0035E3489F